MIDVGALYVTYAASLVAYFGRRLGADADLAADLTHETFARACAAADRYEARGYQPRAWLYRIAHNLLVDHQRRRRLPCCPLDERAQAVPGDAGDLAGDVADTALWTAVDGLLPKQRAVVLCWVCDGLTARETGVRLGMSEGSVKKLRTRALGRLRRRLGRGVTA